MIQKRSLSLLIKSAGLLSLTAPGLAFAADCSNLNNWDSAVAYVTGNEVQHNQIAYRANWWTRNQSPDTHSSAFQEWTNLGACDNGNISPQVSITSPLDNSSFSENDNVVISANASDQDGNITEVTFSVDGVEIAVESAEPYSTNWTASVGQHTIEATATDNAGASTSSSVTISVTNPDNIPPMVTLTSPNASSNVSAGDNLSLAADASDSDGNISAVEFYVDDTRVGTDGVSPYQQNWIAEAGEHSFRAKAIDNESAETFSASVSLTVANSSPGGGCGSAAQYVAGTAYQQGEVVQNLNHRYSCDVPGWCSSPAGWAYEPGRGQHWQSAWTDLGICAIAPEVSINSPANNAVVLAGTEVTISASASDEDGSIAQVEFQANGTTIGTDVGAPYSALWNADVAGETQLKAIATDNEGNSSEATVLVTVSDEPLVISLTSPSSGGTVSLGNSVNLSAEASPVVGSVDSVVFSVNGSVVATDNAFPYSTNWTPGSTGTYIVSATATDSSGNSATSSAVTINVTDAPVRRTHRLIGYWHNFVNGSGCPTRLGDISSDWDVIDIAFADNDVTSNGTVHFNLFDGTGSSCPGIDPDQFKQDIAALQAQGKVVVLSLGGAEGTITLNTDSDQANFVSSLTSIINEWGFDGLDIDLESGSNLLHGTQIQARLPGAIKQIEQNIGGNMYLTMAPEHPYVQGGIIVYSGIWGAYIPVIDGLRDTLDLLHVQLYNNSGLSNPYSTQPAPEGSVDMMVASARMLLEGFTLANGEQFAPLRDDQVAFGLPSGPGSANSGQAPSQNIIDALDCMTIGTGCGSIVPNGLHPNFGGVMTWSINWDRHDGFNFSGPIGAKLTEMNANR
ncbi:chitinase [Alteromonadaceae bacterium M269]|nr:chitinase [Alteromonadaceae bacterium M269]